MNEHSTNPMSWYSQRELAHCPPHFVLMKNPLTPEIKQWVLDTMVGRFSVVDNKEIDGIVYITGGSYGYIAFEDPVEAIVYTLKW